MCGVTDCVFCRYLMLISSWIYYIVTAKFVDLIVLIMDPRRSRSGVKNVINVSFLKRSFLPSPMMGVSIL